MAKVIVFGTGQTACVAHYYLTHDSPHDVVAFTVDRSHLNAPTLFDLPVVPFEEVDSSYPPTEYEMLVAIAFGRVNRLRAERYQAAKDKGYRLVSYVSSRASTWDGLVVGENSMVMEGALIQPFVVLGDDVVVGPGSYIGHHTTIGNHVYLASHVDVSGNVVVEPFSFLGASSTIRDGIRIARECVIGANVTMLRSTSAREVYASPRVERMLLPSDKLPRI